MPFGYIAIFPADGGSAKLETKDMPKNASVIDGTFKAITDIAKAAGETLGDDKVEVVPAKRRTDPLIEASRFSAGRLGPELPLPALRAEHAGVALSSGAVARGLARIPRR